MLERAPASPFFLIGDTVGKIRAPPNLEGFLIGEESKSMLSKEVMEAAAGVEGSSRVCEGAVAMVLDAGDEQLR